MHFVILPRITRIISERKSIIDSDNSLTQTLDDQITELRLKAEALRKQASQKYQVQLEESAKLATKEREKSLEDLKEKIDSMTQKSRQEIKDFVEKSQERSQAATQSLIQIIKTKIFS